MVFFFYYYTGSNEVTDEDIHNLYLEANKGAMIMDFLWVLWSIVQSYIHRDSSGFDYTEYGILRYQHYQTLKTKLLT